MKQSLITSSDIIRNTNYSRSVTPALLKPHIDPEMIIMSAYNIDFYKALIGDLKDYSGVANLNPEESYIAGNLVLYQGIIFECIEAVSNVNDIMCNDGFERASMFTDDCLISIEKYLRLWLSWEIAYSAAPFLRSEVNGKGIIYQENDGRGKQAVDQSRYNSMMAGYNMKRSKYRKMLDGKIMEAYEEYECESLGKSGLGGLNCSKDSIGEGYGGYGVIYRN